MDLIPAQLAVQLALQPAVPLAVRLAVQLAVQLALQLAVQLAWLGILFFSFFPPRTRLKGNVEQTEAVEKTSDGERTPENATYM